MIFFFLLLFRKREEVNLKVRGKLSMFYAGGAALAILPTAVYLLAMDALNETVHNIFLYNLSHQMMFGLLPPTSFSRIILLEYGAISLCFAPLVGIGLIARHLFDEQRFRLLVLWEGSVLFLVYPRFGLFHFIVALAPAIVMVTIFLDCFWSELRVAFSMKNQKCNIMNRPARRRVSVILVLVILYAGFYADISYLRLQSKLYRDENYEVYEAALNELAEYIQEVTLPTEKIFILGIRPEIYFFSHREATGGYSSIFPWDTHPEMQESIIDQLIKERVRLIIFENGSVDGIHITEYAWRIYNFIILNYYITRTFPGKISVFQQNRSTQIEKNAINVS